MWEKPLWLRRRLPVGEDGITHYDEPKKLYINYQPAGGFLSIQKHGENIDNIWTAYPRVSTYSGVFHYGDLVYLNGDEPKKGTPEYESGRDATAIVTKCEPQNVVIALEFTRNKSK